jgi:hypothetical protein
MKNKLDLETRLSVPQQVMSRLVEDETVLLDIASGTYFGLDGVGKRIWENVADGLSLGDIATVITAEFEVDDSQAQSDVIDFATELVDRGLLDIA